MFLYRLSRRPVDLRVAHSSPLLLSSLPSNPRLSHPHLSPSICVSSYHFILFPGLNWIDSSRLLFMSELRPGVPQGSGLGPVLFTCTCFSIQSNYQLLPGETWQQMGGGGEEAAQAASFCPLNPPPRSCLAPLFSPPAWVLVSLKDTLLLLSISKMGHKSKTNV